MSSFVIGLDFGTDSVRALLLNTSDGKEEASAVHYFERWKSLKYCKPIDNQFRQHPQDHIDGLENTIKAVIKSSGIDPNQIKAIAIDTTGSSPLPLAEDGEPLAFKKGFENNPHAMMVLWKDHTAVKEAEEINKLVKTWGGVDYLKYEGGMYSSEWFWAKILNIVRKDKSIADQAYTWMEHCDYMTYLLVENKNLKEFKRSRCAAGHKAMWHSEWNGLPAQKFLSLLHPYLGELRKNLYDQTYTSDHAAGHLSSYWAARLGLSTGTVISVGTFDAHAGAVGARIQEKSLVRVMGTSTCDIIVSSNNKYNNNTVKGICGQVDGSVIPGLIGLEAGQSAFGDVLSWFKNILDWPINHIVLNSNIITDQQKKELQIEFDETLIQKLTAASALIPFDESIPIALDWINGRRTPDTNQYLKGAISNINLGATAPHLFLSLILSICFGSKAIVDRFTEEGVEIDQIIGIGGVAKKSDFIMQTLSDTLNMPIQIVASEQTPALGAGIYASLAAKIFGSYQEASTKLGSKYITTYTPNPSKVEILKYLMKKYTELGISVEKLLKISKQ